MAEPSTRSKPSQPLSKISRSVLFKKTEHAPKDAPVTVRLIIRPITPDDEIRERVCVQKMSLHSKYLRFFTSKKELTDVEVVLPEGGCECLADYVPTKVRYYTHINYRTSFALAAVDPATDSFVAIARFMEDEVAVLVLDDWQGYRIGQYITEFLFEIAKREGKEKLFAIVMMSNLASRHVFDRLTQKYRAELRAQPGQVEFTYFLNEPPSLPESVAATHDPILHSAIARKVTFTHHKDPSREVTCIVRPISPDDEERERECVRQMSVDAKYQRFFYAKDELTDDEVRHYTHVDYTKEFALVAVDIKTDKFVAIARYMCNEDEQLESAVLVLDDYHRFGIGLYLTDYLFEIGKRYGKEILIGVVMMGNIAMRKIYDKLAQSYHTDVTQDGRNLEYRFHLQGVEERAAQILKQSAETKKEVVDSGMEDVEEEVDVFGY